MKIEIITEDYNESLHGKPWIAKIDISEFPKVVYEWGAWVGTPGNIGVLIIDAEDGDIIARGQDDYQNDRYSIHYFYSLVAGELVPIKESMTIRMKNESIYDMIALLISRKALN